MNTIFQTYTGNAMLNNALMTIEALAGLNNVSEISPSLLKELYYKVDLKNINKRLKSYTMVFSLNNPLVNPAKKANNAGEITYHHLLTAIMDSFESEGERVCEISGLRFNKTFDEFYKEELERQKNLLLKKSKDKKLLKKELKNIENTDTCLNRTWFPLIGGLGSDAQALPQAKFTVQIHPICISILQFLPLSVLLYRGGILLVDSSNFKLSRAMVHDNTKKLAEKIEAVPETESVDNVKDFQKGDYLIKALNILTEKEEMDESYSDLNMWSFSNSGTGASCDIDRVPNSLIRKLQKIYGNPKTANELKHILSQAERSYRFIESLEGNNDWSLLYPNEFGSGKKRVEYKGVSPDFLEAYYSVIGKSEFIPMAKYIAGLIEKYKSKTLQKMLEKTDAWAEPEYRVELFQVFVKATENSEWSLEHQISILDNPRIVNNTEEDDTQDQTIKNNYYKLHKLIHYFTQKEIYNYNLPDVDMSKSKIYEVCVWIIGLIQNDSRFSMIKSNLTNLNEYMKVGYNRVIIDALNNKDIQLENIIEIFYDREYNYRKFGLNELLRIFFSQPKQKKFDYTPLKNDTDDLFDSWKRRIQLFVDDYQLYYYTRYQNPLNNEPPYGKFLKTVSNIVTENDDFYSLLSEMIYNTNQFLNNNKQLDADKWQIEDLLTDPLGGSKLNICVQTLKFLLKETAIKPIKEKEQINKINYGKTKQHYGSIIN